MPDEGPRCGCGERHRRRSAPALRSEIVLSDQCGRCHAHVGRIRSALPARERRERLRRVCSLCEGRVLEARDLCRSSPDAAQRGHSAGKDPHRHSESAGRQQMSLARRALVRLRRLRPRPGTQAFRASPLRIAPDMRSASRARRITLNRRAVVRARQHGIGQPQNSQPSTSAQRDGFV
jgi:hypothetical protein